MKKYSHTGILKHNAQLRYSLQDNHYFTSGDSIEVFYDDVWIQGRIEYSHHYQDYYFINESEGIYIYDLEDIKARC